jgi:hypothetical protein
MTDKKPSPPSAAANVTADDPGSRATSPLPIVRPEFVMPRGYSPHAIPKQDHAATLRRDLLRTIDDLHDTISLMRQEIAGMDVTSVTLRRRLATYEALDAAGRIDRSPKPAT